MNPYRLLIVEDEAIVAMDIEERLAALGYELAGGAETGEQALRLVEERRPDLVLMDIRLRGVMDGITAADEIRRRFHLPVIFLTAYSEDATLERAKLAEPYGYILKPFNDRELKSAIEIALYKHKAEREILRLNRLYELLSQVSQTIVHTRTRDELLNTVCRLVVEKCDADLAWIGWLDPESAQISPLAWHGNDREILEKIKFFADHRPEGQGNPGKAIREGKSFICNRCDSAGCLYPASNSPAVFGLNTCGSFPVRFQGQVHGVLNLFTKEADFFQEREISLLEEVAAAVSFALDKIEGDARRDKVTRALRASEAKFRSYIEHAPLGVLVIDQSGSFVEVNSAAAGMLGYDVDEFIGLSAGDLLTPQLSEEESRNFLTPSDDGVAAGEFLLRRKDGARLLTSIQAVRLEDEKMLAFCQDITEQQHAKESLQESEARLRLFIEHAPASLAMFDREMRFMSASRRWMMDYNLGERDLTGLSHYDVFPEIPEYWSEVHRYALSGEVVRSEGDRFVRSDGSERWLRWEVRPWRDQKGSVAGIVIFSEDITDRKLAHEVLRESEERFRRAMEATSDGIWDWDVKSGSIYFSPAISRLLGYEPESFPDAADAWLELVHPDDRELVMSAKEACIRNEAPNINVEFRMCSRDGAWRWILGRGEAVRRDAAGLALRMIGTHEDITGRKRAEERLKEYEKAVENLDEMIVVMNRDYRYLIANRAFLNYRRMEREQVIGHPCDEILDKQIFEKILKPKIEECFRGKVVKFELKYTYPELGQRDLFISYFPMEGPDGIDRVVGVFQDITDRKRLEEEQAQVEAQLRQAQKMEALGVLAGGIAHDFNNILGIIFGYSEIGRAIADDPKRVREYFMEVLKAAGRAKDLVKQILAFSRRGPQEQQPVQVGLIVNEVLKMLRASLPSTIEIRKNIASRSSVMADPTQIHQVMMNLCANAAHAMGGGVGVLEVTLADVDLAAESIPLHSRLRPGRHIRLTVKDTGHGIDPSILDRIFDPFFTTKEQGVGTGLGLSVVHGIVQSHGGAVTVESSPGNGATFMVFFPAMEAVAQSSFVAASSLPGGRERILVVDDEPGLAIVTKKMLERLGYRVEFETSGLEALKTFRKQSKDKVFDLVVTDMTMPNFTGADLARELLKLQPDLPILLCTGFSEMIDAEKSESMGFKGFLMKPIVLKELAAMVRKALGMES